MNSNFKLIVGLFLLAFGLVNIFFPDVIRNHQIQSYISGLKLLNLYKESESMKKNMWVNSFIDWQVVYVWDFPY